MEAEFLEKIKKLPVGHKLAGFQPDETDKERCHTPHIDSFEEDGIIANGIKFLYPDLVAKNGARIIGYY